ncbi:MAG TPA: YdcF family protein [Steroidobacteraceae bacterium]|nr:YdcF family protein [Steroidobacteraceae bacterium]
MDIFVWKLMLKNLVLPPTGPLVIVLVGLLLTRSARYRRAGLTLCAGGALVLWLLATPAIADALVRAVERYPPLDLTKPVNAEAIVILGAGVRLNAPEYGSSAPSATTLERLAYGARVGQATGLPVLVSGSHYEAAAMNTFLQREFGVTPRWVENHSHDTRENAVNSAAILARDGIHRIVLVTSSAHMVRALREFRACGMSVVPAPAELWTRRDLGLLVWVPNAEALVRAQRALYEVLGQLAQSIRFALAAHGLWHEGPPVPPRRAANRSAPRPALR